MCPDVNAGTHSNCIPHKLILLFKKSRWARSPCWWMDWWTRLLCLVSLLLIFLLLFLLLLLLLPFFSSALRCRLAVQWNRWMCWWVFKWLFGVETKRKRFFYFSPTCGVINFPDCSVSLRHLQKLNFCTSSLVVSLLTWFIIFCLCRKWTPWQQDVWHWGSKWLSTRSSWPTWRPSTRRWGRDGQEVWLQRDEAWRVLWPWKWLKMEHLGRTGVLEKRPDPWWQTQLWWPGSPCWRGQNSRVDRNISGEDQTHKTCNQQV